jgi:hypothetical protein
MFDLCRSEIHMYIDDIRVLMVALLMILMIVRFIKLPSKLSI